MPQGHFCQPIRLKSNYSSPAECWRHSEIIVIHLLQSSTSLPSDVCVCLTSVNHISSTLCFGFFCCCCCFICLFCNFWIWLSDVNDCENQPCKNGGQCRDLDGDYSCQCPSPYVGKQCQLRMCTTIRHTHFKHGQPVVTRFASTFFINFIKDLKNDEISL